jgi:hypothetical protein
VQTFNEVVEQEQRRFLDEMQLKAGIGKNYPLSENVFVTITCILN